MVFKAAFQHLNNIIIVLFVLNFYMYVWYARIPQLKIN